MELLKNRRNGKSEREFIRKHVDAANALIGRRAVPPEPPARRGQGDRGEAARTSSRSARRGLKVLRMCDLAVELECDPSTVSRTVADKYMQTPRGHLPVALLLHRRDGDRRRRKHQVGTV